MNATVSNGITTGRIFLLGDDIDTDQLAPGQYMKDGIAELAAHCLDSVRPGFSAEVKAGDFIVAGRNFGLGSSREQAAEALKFLGIQAVIARSFAGIFYRNAINLGLPALTAAHTDFIQDGDSADLKIEHAQLNVRSMRDPDSMETLSLDSVPDNIQVLLADGGLVPHLKKRFAAIKSGEQTT